MFTTTPMDARVLPDGTTVGRDDPRYYDAAARGPDDDWQRRVRASLAGLRAGNFTPMGGDPATTNFALRPNVAGVRRALNLMPHGSNTPTPPPISDPKPPPPPGTLPVGGKPPTPVPVPKDPTTPTNPLTPSTPPPPPSGGGGRLPSGDTSGGQNPLMPSSGPNPLTPATPPPPPSGGGGRLPSGDVSGGGNPLMPAGPATPVVPVTPAPTSGPSAPAYGTGTNPAAQTFLGGDEGGSAVANWREILDARAAAAGNLPFTPSEPSGGPPKAAESNYVPLPASANFFHGGALKNGGRVRMRGMKPRRAPITIDQHHGPDLSQVDGEDPGYAQGGRVSYAGTMVEPVAHGDPTLPPDKGGLSYTPTTPVMPSQQPQAPVATDPVMPPIMPPIATTPVMPPAVQPPVATTPVMPPSSNNPLTPPVYAGADDTGGGYHLPGAPVAGTPMPKPQPSASGTATPFTPAPGTFRPGGTAQPFSPAPGQFRPGGTAAPFAPPAGQFRPGGNAQPATPAPGQFRPAMGGMGRSQMAPAPLKFADGGRVPYAEYVRRNQHPASFYQDAGVAPPADGGLPFTEAQWNALPLAQQYGNLGGDGSIVSAAGHNIAVNGTQGADGWVTVYGRPQLYGHPDSQWLDPSGLRDNGDGTFSFNPDKINGARLAHYQQVDSDTGLGDGTHFAIAGIGAVVGGGLAAGAMGAGAAGESVGAGLAGDESAGLSMANPFNPLDESAGLNMSGGAGLDESAGLDMNNPFGTDPSGSFEANYPGNQPITPEQLAQNPSVQQAASRAGQTVSQWLSNPTNLASAGRFIAGLAGAAGAHGTSSSSVPLITNPTAVTTPGGGAAAVNPANDPLSYLAGLDPTANWRASGGGDYVRRLQAEADQAGSPAAQEAAAGRAEGDVAQRMARAREARNARLTSQGINPYAANGPGAELERQSRFDEARAAVGGENAARIAEENKGWSRRAAAAGLGLTNSGQALQADALGNNLATTRAGFADRGAQRTWQSGENAADRDVRVQQINAGIQQNNNATNRQSAIDTGAGVDRIINTASNLPWRSIWDTLTGAKDGLRVRAKGLDRSNGGHVDGPGTGTSDSIPAKLSDGEFVLNSEATQMIDKLHPGFLEKANERGLKIRNVRARGLGSRS